MRPMLLMRWARRSAVAALALIAAGALTPGAHAGPEEDLAAKHAPVVRLADRAFRCEYGEPYGPIDVDLLFDEPTVALRGAWGPGDLVKIAPTADDLTDLFEYHLDFPGNALDPGCDYERWAARLKQGSAPTVYAHVVTEPGRPGKVALQYWAFYVFNDFNNLHEGDWEMIQLVFDADDAEEALRVDPVSVGYSSHEGAESADWGEDKLELVDGTHPVVYPAAGSHANKYTEALYLGSSAEAGVGCDDTRGPHRETRPVVKTIPSDPAAARAAFPWIAFEGRWGEKQEAFFNGPRGPNLNDRWTAPITWSDSWRDKSYAVPTGGVLGTEATDFFCTAVETGSKGLIALLRNPTATLILLGLVLALVLWMVSRTTWRPGAPLRMARRRAWGQVLSSSLRMLLDRPLLFFGIGLLFIPLGFVISLVQAALLGGFGLLGVDVTGESAGALVLFVVAAGAALALLGAALVQAATACAVVEIDNGRPIRPFEAYRLASTRLRPLVGGLGTGAIVWALLMVTGFLAPIAIWLFVRWLLLAPVVELERRSGVGSLRRSAELVRGRWFRVASLVGVGAVLAFAAGPFVGALLILLTDAPFALLNVVAGLVYALAMPFVALTSVYVYFDARVREELAEERQPRELPAEAAI